MPSIAEVRVCDALSPEDAASLEEDDAPQTRKPPKDFIVSFAKSVSRTANVYTSSRPPSRRGVSGGPTRHTLPKRSEKRGAFSGGQGGFGSSLPSSLDNDPALRRLHEDAKASKSLAKTYKHRLVIAEKAADAYRNASFEAKAKVSRLEAATRKLFGDATDDAKTTLARLDKEREATRVKLEACEGEINNLRRANETVRRSKTADRKKHRDAEKAFKDELASSIAATRTAREELAAERKNARRLTLEVRTLEAKLFRPEPPSLKKAVSMNTAPSDCHEGDPESAPACALCAERLEAPPQTEPQTLERKNLVFREEEDEEDEDEDEADDEALTDTEVIAPVVPPVPVVTDSPSSPSRLSLPGSSSGGDKDAPRVVVCVVCVEPEVLPAPAAGAKTEDAENETTCSYVSNDAERLSVLPPSFSFSEDAEESLTAGSLKSDSPASAPDANRRSSADGKRKDARAFGAVSAEQKKKREGLFFARTTVASRSRAGTLQDTF